MSEHNFRWSERVKGSEIIAVQVFETYRDKENVSTYMKNVLPTEAPNATDSLVLSLNPDTFWSDVSVCD